jgi:hypothetical protein
VDPTLRYILVLPLFLLCILILLLSDVSRLRWSSMWQCGLCLRHRRSSCWTPCPCVYRSTTTRSTAISNPAPVSPMALHENHTDGILLKELDQTVLSFWKNRLPLLSGGRIHLLPGMAEEAKARDAEPQTFVESGNPPAENAESCVSAFYHRRTCFCVLTSIRIHVSPAKPFIAVSY